MKKISLIIASFLMLTVPVSAFAQSAILTSPTITLGPGPVVLCSSIASTLQYGQRDPAFPKEVTILQNFLNKKGYLQVMATGYFGPLTLQAVRSFQQQNGLQADGIVGPMTRARISAVDCPTTPVAMTPTILGITPTAGPTGTIMTITGTGFTDSNIVHFSVGGIGNLPSAIVPVASGMNGTILDAISFTVPSSIGPYCQPDQACPMYEVLLNAGSYPVSVENANGTSNTVQFTITKDTTPIPN
jgi:hypothetical protein